MDLYLEFTEDIGVVHHLVRDELRHSVQVTWREGEKKHTL